MCHTVARPNTGAEPVATVTDEEVLTDERVFGDLEMTPEPVEFYTKSAQDYRTTPKEVTTSELAELENGELVSVTSGFSRLYFKDKCYYNMGIEKSGVSGEHLYLGNDIIGVGELSKIPRLTYGMIVGTLNDAGGVEGKTLILASNTTLATIKTEAESSAMTKTPVTVKAVGEYVGKHEVKNIHEETSHSNQWTIPVILATRIEIVPNK